MRAAREAFEPLLRKLPADQRRLWNEVLQSVLFHDELRLVNASDLEQRSLAGHAGDVLCVDSAGEQMTLRAVAVSFPSVKTTAVMPAFTSGTWRQVPVATWVWNTSTEVYLISASAVIVQQAGEYRVRPWHREILGYETTNQQQVATGYRLRVNNSLVAVSLGQSRGWGRGVLLRLEASDVIAVEIYAHTPAGGNIDLKHAGIDVRQVRRAA